jgi:Tfp pilus assembly protein PilO
MMKPNLFKLSGLPQRRKYVLYVAVTLVIAVFFDRFILQPTRDKIDKINSGIFIQEKKLRNYLKVISRKDSITGEYRKYTEGIIQDNSEEEEKLKLLSEIEKIARSSSVLLKDIKPGPVKKSGLYRRYAISIEAEATINYLTDFIYQLEKTPRLLRVEDFQLSPKEKNSATLRARMTISEALIEKDGEPKEETRNKE